MNEPLYVCGLSISGDSGQRAEQEQEVGVAVSLQEEVGLSGGARSHRGGEDGVSSAHPSCFQTQKILPLRRNRQRGRFLTLPAILQTHTHTHTHTHCIH